MKKGNFRYVFCTAIIFLGAVVGAHAAGHTASERVHVMKPWSRAMPSVSTNGAAYFSAMNKGETDRRIVAGRSPIAERVELHTHKMEDGVARMTRLDDGILVPAGGSVTLAPGGMHVMLMGLIETLDAGKTFPLVLEFEDGSTLEIEIPVLSPEEVSEMGAGMGHGAHGSHGEMKAKE